MAGRQAAIDLDQYSRATGGKKNLLNLSIFDNWMNHSPSVDNYTRKTAERFMRKAIMIFNSQVEHTHPVTPPPYASSFKIQRARRGLKRGWDVVNTDPAAVWVEFGAHAGGQTQILGYRVFGKTIDAMQGGGG